jgi:hypothetical protein
MRPPYLKERRQFQTAETLEFDALCVSRFEQATQDNCFNLK